MYIFNFLLIITLLSIQALCHSVNFEIGEVKTNFNYFQLPNERVNRVNLPQDESNTTIRLRGLLNIDQKSKLYFLIAPLKIDYNFISQSNFKFDNTNFNSNLPTKVEYQFNSYRIGYLRFVKYESLHFWYGAVLKIRDAFIKVKQQNLSDQFDNVGIVPLLSFGLNYNFSESFSFYTHTDALTASQGSAYDSQLELRFKGIGFGKRILGGGADNDTLLNFAQFDSYYLNYTYKI